MLSICVYLGANSGDKPHFSDAAMVLGHAIAAAKYRLIYGGSSLGLMGVLAHAVMAAGGLVTGIIPKQLIVKEKPLKTLDELVITDSMHERKRLMEQRADAFIVMPGGLGTLEEAFDTWNAIKIGTLNKPIGFLNIDGYFDGLFEFINTSVKRGFVSDTQAKIPKINANPHALLTALTLHERFITSSALV